MNPDKKAQENIKLHFRQSFETQRDVSEAEHRVFKEGIVRHLSNLTIYEVTKQYREDPNRFNQPSIFDAKSEDEEEIDAADVLR